MRKEVEFRVNGIPIEVSVTWVADCGEVLHIERADGIGWHEANQHCEELNDDMKGFELYFWTEKEEE
jgi:hypothetical protein